MTSGEWGGKDIESGEPPKIDTSEAHSARIYDYILGGKDNFEADRRAAEAAVARNPNMAAGMRANRAVMRRMTAYLAGKAGIRQFLDIGTGLPTSPNMHEIAQRIAPDSRVVYVDNDPIVLAHARALLVSTAKGACTYIDADARDPEGILADPALSGTIDLSRPVALMLFGIVHFLPDSDNPRAVVARFLEALPAGSYLAIQHPTADFYPPGVGSQSAYRGAGIPFQYRSKAEFARFLDGLELVEPGITPMSEWHPELEPGPQPGPSEAGAYAALGRKP
ncbi:MAG TPA: SAM-dependent methyltransferase [Trebonia sp.]